MFQDGSDPSIFFAPIKRVNLIQKPNTQYFPIFFRQSSVELSNISLKKIRIILL